MPWISARTLRTTWFGVAGSRIARRFRRKTSRNRRRGLGVGAQGDPPAYTLIGSNEFSDCNHGVHIKTSDNVIRGNHFYGMQHGYRGYGTGVYLRSGPRTVVENNLIERAQWAGIRVLGDDQLIRNNIIVDTPVGIWLTQHSYGGAGRSTWVVHNTVLESVVPMWLEGGTGAFAFNNIFGTSSPRELAIVVAGRDMINPMETWRAEWYTRMAGQQEPAATLVADYNLFYQCSKPRFDYYSREDPSWHRHFQLYGAHNVESEPGFVDAAAGNYRLDSGSAARGAGRGLPNCPLDAEGAPRPPPRPDCGAFQSGTGIDRLLPKHLGRAHGAESAEHCRRGHPARPARKHAGGRRAPSENEKS